MSNQPQIEREKLGSRLGFILLSAGCAIGLGNVWRFPYVCGQYGGAIFLMIYLLFLLLLGYPVMVMELSVGRAGQQDLTGCYSKLQPPGSRFPWVKLGRIAFFGNVILLMFYTVITGWLLSYTYSFISGEFKNITEGEMGKFFGDFLANVPRQITFNYLSIAITIAICIAGLKKGVERITKVMMIGLFALMIGLAIESCLLPDAEKGIAFLLQPDLETLKDNGIWSAVHAAMSQAFFTLSLGIGSIAIFGSYIGKDKSLPQEASIIIGLDTFVAICSGLIIFPCCFAFNVEPGAGPSLIFITIPQIFQDASYGSLRGFVFFIFLSIAALTTLIAVSENIIAFGIDQLKLSRRKSTLLTGAMLAVLSLPCLFGFNIWSSFEPLGKGTCILDLEDFIVSANLLPLGALMLLIFCTRRYGWGLDNFLAEANTGHGIKLPRKFFAFYISWVLPIIIVALWIIGILKQFKVI